MHHRAVCRLAFAALVVTSAACRDQASPSDFGGTELTSSQLLAAPTNAVADDPAAVELGQQVFFDRGLSSDGTVACVDCHDPANGFSDRALPGDPEWDRMPKALQADIQRVFTNVGKAVEAYERKLLCTDTKFDRWQRGEVQLSSDELAGGDTFNREHCSRCHSGPSLSDGEFTTSVCLRRTVGVRSALRRCWMIHSTVRAITRTTVTRELRSYWLSRARPHPKAHFEQRVCAASVNARFSATRPTSKRCVVLSSTSIVVVDAEAAGVERRPGCAMQSWTT
jgi:cytochrome c peroxidase